MPLRLNAGTANGAAALALSAEFEGWNSPAVSESTAYTLPLRRNARTANGASAPPLSAAFEPWNLDRERMRDQALTISAARRLPMNHEFDHSGAACSVTRRVRAGRSQALN